MIAFLGKLAAAARRHGLGGLLRAGRDAADRLFLAAGRPPLRVSVDGLAIRGFLRHRSFLAHLGRGDYEPYLRLLYLEALDGSDLVLDVGAHAGFYALLARRRRPHARVVAVEADPYNAAALRANVRAAGTPVEVVEMAASDAVGRATFRQNLGTVGSSLIERPGTGPTRVVEVETTTIDAVAGDAPVRSLLLKLDVEGAERRALAGAERTIRAAEAAVVLVELNPRALAAAGDTGADLVADLERLGLRVDFIDEEQKALEPPAGADRKGNLLARK